MSKITVKLNPAKFTRSLLGELKKRMMKVAIMLEGATKSSMTTSNLGGSNPSRPGQAPHVGTGNLRNNIASQVSLERNSVVAKYGILSGSTAPYARRLELGFNGVDSKGRNINQAPRPFLKPQLRKNKRKIKDIIRNG